MAIEIRVPNLPESVSSATVATWHVKAGDAVKREQNLVDLETDKVMLEVPATADGVLTEVRIASGATVAAGDVIGVMEEGGSAVAPSASAASAPAKTDGAKGDDPQSPAVRKLLAELNLSAAGIPASGKGGRLTVEDVKAYSDKQKATPKAAPAP
ncbi:MAG TPA: biotin/lipoyl-containing protein, partial [Nevskiaceae bacterium]|nr:biotin/lipoyl-containing protein [Nevskiaceae bacterium]